MVHLVSTALGLGLTVVSLVGLFTATGPVWLVWVVGAAGLILVGAGSIDRHEVSHDKRAQALVLVAVALAGALLIGRSTATWFLALAAVGTASAFAAGVATLARP